MEDIFKKIRDTLAEQLSVDPDSITMDTDIVNDLEADSLDAVDLVMSMEDEFGFEVLDEDIENLHTVGDFVRYVADHTANND